MPNDLFPPDGTAQELLPALNIIRSETVLSKLPIHNLSKKGSIDIRIARKNAGGEIELLWSVSPSRAHGEPRQLAYKIDTLLINRRIEEAGRPLPHRLRLGSMKEICSELELPVSGRSYAEIKRALMQNAFAGVTAKVRYRGIDGRERTLEAAFTRYGVIFTGDKFPDGSRADAVYLVFNEPYLEVLNNAPLRPLDYDYLKALTPGAQRFYEIVSYRMFASIRHGLPHAKISYSDYCMFSAQQRYVEYDRVKKQMYKLHRPHLASGYLKRAHLEPIEGGDQEGQPDWMMFYAPGRKARLEYRSYHQRAARRDESAPGPALSATLPEQAPTSAGSEDAVPQPPVVSSPPTADDGVTQLNLGLISPEDLVAVFHKLTKGLQHYESFTGSREPSQAAEILDTYGPDKALYIVEYAVQAAKRTKFEMRTFGALKQYVQEAADHFDAQQRQRDYRNTVHELRERREKEAAEEVRRGELLYANLSKEDKAVLKAQVVADLKREHVNIVSWEGESMAAAVKQSMVKALVQREKSRRT